MGACYAMGGHGSLLMGMGANLKENVGLWCEANLDRLRLVHQ